MEASTSAALLQTARVDARTNLDLDLHLGRDCSRVGGCFVGNFVFPLSRATGSVLSSELYRD